MKAVVIVITAVFISFVIHNIEQRNNLPCVLTEAEELCLLGGIERQSCQSASTKCTQTPVPAPPTCNVQGTICPNTQYCPGTEHDKTCQNTSNWFATCKPQDKKSCQSVQLGCMLVNGIYMCRSIRSSAVDCGTRTDCM